MADSTEEIELKLTTAGGKTVKRTLSGVKEEVSDVAEEAEEAGQEGAESFERMGDSAGEAAREVDRASERMESTTSSIDRMGGASSNASELLFSLGDTAQDAQYGLRGMGNNIGFAAEQASVLVSQAGSGKQALNALSSAVVGPAGAVFAIQALISLGPKIVDFFQGSEEATKEWEKSLEDAAGSIFDIKEEVSDFEAATLEQAKQVREQLKQSVPDLEQEIGDLEQLKDLMGQASEAGVELSQMGEAVGIASRQDLDLATVTVQQIEERLERRRELLKATEQGVEAVDTQIVQLKAAKRVSEAYGQTAASRAETEEDAAQALKEQVQDMEALKAASLQLATNIGKELQKARQKYERGKEIQRSINIRQRRSGAGPLEGQIGPDRIQAPQLSAEDFKTETISQVNSTIGVLQRRMDSVDSSNLQKEIKGAIGNLKGMKRQMMLAEGEAVDLGPALQQGLANSIAAAATAIGKGESVAEALLKTLGDLAQRVGQLLIAFGIGGESLKAIFQGNPGLAIAAGASLIALGTAAKSAVQSEVESATGGQGSTVSRQRGDGEGGVDVPSFRSGVDGFAGGLAEVHRNEIVALPPGSNVVTNENAQAIKGMMSVLSAGSEPGKLREIDVNQNTNLNIDINEPDLFEVASKLEEANRVLDRIARQ